MPKQHALLAVLATKKKTADDTLADTKRTFGKIDTYFSGSVKTTKAHDEARSKELDGTEHQALTTTVPVKLQHTTGLLAGYLDVICAIDTGNTIAKADFVLGGKTVLENVPAPTLIAIEREFKKLLEVLKDAPTHPLGKEWEEDKDAQHPGTYKTVHDVVTKRTEQTIVAQVLAPATDKHPAQVDKLSVQKAIADITTSFQTGTISSAEKARLCERCQEIITAAAEALTRANDVEVNAAKIGDKLYAFVLESPK